MEIHLFQQFNFQKMIHKPTRPLALREELRTKTRTDHNKAKANKSVKHVEV